MLDKIREQQREFSRDKKRRRNPGTVFPTRTPPSVVAPRPTPPHLPLCHVTPEMRPETPVPPPVSVPSVLQHGGSAPHIPWAPSFGLVFGTPLVGSICTANTPSNMHEYMTRLFSDSQKYWDTCKLEIERCLSSPTPSPSPLSRHQSHSTQFHISDERVSCLVWLVWRHGLNMQDGTVLLREVTGHGDTAAAVSTTILADILRLMGYPSSQEVVIQLLEDITVGILAPPGDAQCAQDELCDYFGLTRYVDAKDSGRRFITLSIFKLANAARTVYYQYSSIVSLMATDEFRQLVAQPHEVMRTHRKRRIGAASHRSATTWGTPWGIRNDFQGPCRLYRIIFKYNAEYGMLDSDDITAIRRTLSSAQLFEIGHCGVAHPSTPPAPATESPAEPLHFLPPPT